MTYYLGVDIGTSGTKTVLFDVQGTAIASETEESLITTNPAQSGREPNLQG